MGAWQDAYLTLQAVQPEYASLTKSAHALGICNEGGMM